MTKRAVLYARVSRDDRQSDGLNLTSQLEMGQRYAQEHGYSVVAELSEDDRGASGAEIDLPQLNRVRDMAQAGEFDVLVVRELDRLSRNLAKQLIIEQELQCRGVEIEYVLGEYPDTPEGRLHKHVKATIAEYEREKITERTTRARRSRAKAGHVIAHGRAPYGYRLAEVDGKRALVIDEEEARVVRMIFNWYTSEPMGLASITKKLTKMGIPTYEDKRGGKQRGYGKWNRSSVAGMLRNETYAGVWHYGQEAIPVDVPAIISRDVWKLAEARREQNKLDARRNMKYDYLMSKRVTCGQCGSKMTGNPKWWWDRLYLYYVCCARRRKEEFLHDCDLPYIRADHVDTAVWQWIKSFLTNPAALAKGLKGEQRQRDKLNEPLKERLAVVESLLAQHGQQLERALDLYLSGEFSREMVTARKVQLEKIVGELERERNTLTSKLTAQSITDEQIETVTQYAQQVARGLQKADTSFEARRRIVEMLNVQVTLTVEDGQKVAYVRCLIDEDVLPIVSTSS